MTTIIGRSSAAGLRRGKKEKPQDRVLRLLD